jgi:putative aldouronate transport system permease protein
MSKLTIAEATNATATDSTITGSAKKSRRTEWYHLKKNSELLLLLMPGALLVLIFSYLPMFGTVLAFKDFRYDKGFWGSEWIGFDNFKFFFVSDNAWLITRNTVGYGLIYMILTTVIALTFAILMNEMGKKWLRIHQTAMFIPYCLSWVVVSYLALALLDSSGGYLNKILEFFHLDTHMWYLETKPWPYILVSAYLWKNIGFSTLVYFAGIMGINQEYYEAAKIDGASRWQMAMRVTLPMLSTLIVVLLILAIGHIFVGDFGLHYFIPNNNGMTFPTTDIIDTYVFRALRVYGDIGMSTAIGLYQSVVGLVLVITANYVVRKINEENSLF